MLFPGKVMHLYQKHNDVVKVPCGWAHQVQNMTGCVKFAFDVLNVMELCVYATVQKRLIGPFAGVTGQPRDYRGWIVAVEEEVASAMRLVALEALAQKFPIA